MGFINIVERLKFLLSFLFVIIIYNCSAQYNCCDYEKYCDDDKMEILRNYTNYEMNKKSFRVEKYYDKKGSAVCLKLNDSTSVFSGSILINDTLFKVYGSKISEGGDYFGVLFYDNLCQGIINWNYSDLSKCDYCIKLSRIYKNNIIEYDLCENTPHVKIKYDSKYLVKNNSDTLIFDKEVKVVNSISLPRVLNNNELGFISPEVLLKINKLITNAPLFDDSLIYWREFAEFENKINISLRYKTNRNENFLYGVLEYGEEKYKISGAENWAFLWKDSLIVGFVKWNTKNNNDDKLTENELFNIGYYDIHILELNVKGKKIRFDISPSNVFCYNRFNEKVGVQRVKSKKKYFVGYDYMKLYKSNNIEFSYSFKEDKGEFGKGELKFLDAEEFIFEVVNIKLVDGLYSAEIWCGETFKGELIWGETEVDSSTILDYKYCEEPFVKECIDETYELIRKEDKRIVQNGIGKIDVQYDRGKVAEEVSPGRRMIVDAEFSEGNPADYIVERIRIDENDVENGRMIIKFDVELNGSVSNVEILKGINRAIDKKVVKVVRSMPRWRPAKLNGKAIKYKYTLPIVFDN